MAQPILFESTTRPADVFDPWAGDTVSSWSELHARIDEINERHGQGDLYWRGVTDATFGLYSSLYRRLKCTRRAVTEDLMVSEEKRILSRARRDWRFDNMSALEIFAHIQHYGGPTRLLDVTKNPLIAAWFAVEQQYRPDGSPAPPTDARMFCFYGGDGIGLESQWGSRTPAWFDWTSTKERREHSWGDGTNRRIWVPPAYNPRIPAQNAAFIVDGVPFSYGGSNGFTMGPGHIDKRWHIGPLRDAGSIPFKPNDHTRAKQTDRSTPAFTIRIGSGAVSQIRDRIERDYGYSVSSLYGDLYGMATKVSPHLPD